MFFLQKKTFKVVNNAIKAVLSTFLLFKVAFLKALKSCIFITFNNLIIMLT